MFLRRLVIVGFALGLLSACRCADPAETPDSTVPTQASTPAAALADAYWAELLRATPTTGTLLGDRSRDGELPDLSPAARARHDAVLRGLLDRARALASTALDPGDALIVDVVRGRIEQHFADREHCARHTWALDLIHGPLTLFVDLPSFHPVDSEQRARDLIARYRATPRMLGQLADNLRDGLAAGRVADRYTVDAVIGWLDGLLGSPIDDDPLLRRPLEQAIEAGGRISHGFAAQLRAALGEAVRPGLKTFRAVLVDEILPASRSTPGLIGLPGGAACYAAAITHHTGLPLAPQDIHRIGLDEVARIRGEMTALAAEMGHGDVDAALAALAADPAQRIHTRAGLLARARMLIERARPALSRAFGRLPTTEVKVLALPRAVAPSAMYSPGSPDGERPALLVLDVHRIDSWRLYEMPALVFHEAIPGHHLQMRLAHENHDLPAALHHLGSTAFSEGWALYAEGLAGELGLYHDPAERMGARVSEIWRAARLVVDTGLHHLGWSRQQAIDYLRAQTGKDADVVAAEIDRYIVNPGQALAYTLGRLEISRLRAEAEAALGPRFDLRAWHDRLLGDGALPLPVLRRVMAAWVEAQRR